MEHCCNAGTSMVDTQNSDCQHHRNSNGRYAATTFHDDGLLHVCRQQEHYFQPYMQSCMHHIRCMNSDPHACPNDDLSHIFHHARDKPASCLIPGDGVFRAQDHV